MYGGGGALYLQSASLYEEGGGYIEGEGCAQPGGFWGIQLFIRRPSD